MILAEPARRELVEPAPVVVEAVPAAVKPAVVEAVPAAVRPAVVEAAPAVATSAAAPEDVVETVVVSAEPATGGTIKAGLISVSLKEVELSNVIRLFATLSDANIIIPELEAGAGAVKVDVNLKEVEWKPALQAILEGQNLELYEKIASSQVYSIRKKLPPTDAIRNTRTFIFKHADIKQANEMIKGMVGDRGQVFAYPQGNAIVVKTAQEIMDDVAQIAERIDTPRQQVLIEARIMELSDNGSQERGVNLNWDRILDGSAKQLISAGSLGSIGVPVGLKEATLTGIGTLTLNASDLTIMIKALQTKGDARTISNPKVIVANGETARINILEKVPKVQRTLTTETTAGISTKTITVTQQDDGVDDDTKRKRFVEFEFGIRLAVTPTIYSEENIAVQIVPIISRVNTEKTIVSFVGEDGATPPNKIYDTYYAIDEKRVNTTFMLGNKRTAVIGGLTETKNIDRERKVPLLGSIPLIQHLFTHKYSEKVQTENIIFVTVALEDGKSFDVAKAVKQSPLTRKQLVLDENNQVVDDRAVELYKANSDSRIKDEVRVIERKEQAESHARTLLAPVRHILRP